MGKPVTLILGLGRELGDSIARCFHEQAGHDVLGADPSSERIANAKGSLPEEVAFHHGDLHTRIGIRNAITAATERFKRVDHAVVVPELPEPDKLAGLQSERFDKALARSVSGAMLGVKLFSEQLIGQDDSPETGAGRRAQKGSLTFVLGYAALASTPGHFTEMVTQSAILGVVRAAALELADQAIRVNAIVCIRPAEERTLEWTAKRVPLGRAALSDEVAEAALYLSSPGAAFTTGTVLVLDGGRSTLSGLIE
jgi:NAD(P)-dependent dehydrogenase (short-subunit alcohol dehydrogenase family)